MISLRIDGTLLATYERVGIDGDDDDYTVGANKVAPPQSFADISSTV